jgi:hypothetical protein
LVFVGMSADDKELWINTHLAKIRGQMAFQWNVGCHMSDEEEPWICAWSVAT